jgi:hypothetical protein
MIKVITVLGILMASAFSVSAYSYNMVGSWTGSPDCPIQFWQDDGYRVAGNCDNGSYDHQFRGTYFSSNTISGSVTRYDPAGCKTTTHFVITFIKSGLVMYEQGGWRGCGVITGPGTQTWRKK